MRCVSTRRRQWGESWWALGRVVGRDSQNNDYFGPGGEAQEGLPWRSRPGMQVIMARLPMGLILLAPPQLAKRKALVRPFGSFPAEVRAVLCGLPRLSRQSSIVLLQTAGWRAYRQERVMIRCPLLTIRNASQGDGGEIGTDRSREPLRINPDVLVDPCPDARDFANVLDTRASDNSFSYVDKASHPFRPLDN